MVGDALRVDPAKPGGLDVRLSVAAVTSLGRQIEAHLIKRHGAVCQVLPALCPLLVSVERAHLSHAISSGIQRPRAYTSI